MANWLINRVIDLQRGDPVPQVWPAAMMMYGSKLAHKWRVTVNDGGVAAAISGAITGHFKREDGGTVTVAGTLEGNVATVILEAECYAWPGDLQALMLLAGSDDQILPLDALVFKVRRTTTDVVIDPGGIVPSLAEMLALVPDLYNARADTIVATTNAIAAAAGANGAAAAATGGLIWRKASTNPSQVYPAPVSPLHVKASGMYTQAGSGDPSPDNIRALTQWVANGATVKVMRTGKNILDFPTIFTLLGSQAGVTKTVNGATLTLSGTPSITYAQVVKTNYLFYLKSGTQITLGGTITGNQPLLILTLKYADNTTATLNVTNLSSTVSLILVKDVVSITFVFCLNTTTTGTPFTATFTNLQLEIGPVATDYEAFSGDEITLTAPANIWKGYIGNDGVAANSQFAIAPTSCFDTTDLGTVLRCSIVYSSGYAPGVAVDASAKCSHFAYMPVYAGDYEHFYAGSDVIRLYINKTRLASANITGVNAWLAGQVSAGTPVQVLVTPATPIAYASTAVALAALTQADRLVPRQNIVKADVGSFEVQYAQTPLAVTATNILTESNFDDCTTWGSTDGSVVALGNEGIFTYTTVPSTYSRIHQTKTLTLDKYYVAFDILPKYSNLTLFYTSLVGSTGIQAYPIPNVWNHLSGIFNNTVAGAASLFFMHRGDVNYVAGDQVKFRRAMMVDLTWIFGAGYEPTAGQMDSVFSKWPNGHFEGTVDLSRADMEYKTFLALKNQMDEKTGYGVLSGLGVTATTGMNVAIAAGICYEQSGMRYSVPAIASKAITAADATNPRIDIIYERLGVAYYLVGTAAASPVAPTVPTGGLLLAEISVAANVTAITTAMITLKKKTLNSEDWITPTLLNGATASTPVVYRKDADGTVQLRGVVTVTTLETVAFVLPAGYRPNTNEMWYIAFANSAASANYAKVRVMADGGVKIYYYGTNVSISGISFKADQ